MATKLTGDYVNGRGKGTVMREFPDFGPGDTAADRHRLVEGFKNSCCDSSPGRQPQDPREA
jgi:hypothetical protein